jgi:cell surface protein SprA
MHIKKVCIGLVLFLLFGGCGDSGITNETTEQYNYSLYSWDYSDYHYLFDTLYKSSFVSFMNDSTGILPDAVMNNKILSDLSSFQVWVQCDNAVANKKRAVAWMMLEDSVSANGYSDSAKYKRTDEATDSCFYGYFRELSSSEYYISPIAGFIGLKINIVDNYCIGVTYKTASGKKYGMGKYDVNSNQMMVLKMIKCSNLDPDNTPRAWELKMKNIYRLPYQNISENNFRLFLKYQNNDYYYDTIFGMSWPLMQMLKLDRYTGSTRKWKPDGNFDFISGRTIITETGDIIFPSLYPFRDELRNAGVDSNYFFDALYSKSKSIAQISIKSTMYYIKGYSDTLK